MTTSDEIEKLLRKNLSADLLSEISDEMHSEYDNSYTALATPPGMFVPQKNEIIDRLNLDRLFKQRKHNGMNALARFSERCGIPHELKHLRCNGQTVVIAQIGRVILMTEPIRYIDSAPVGADYKHEMAASYAAALQLEFDLGDGYRNRLDARDTVLAVLLHGFRGDSFSRSETSLSMLQLAVPNANFDSWLWRANMRNDEVDVRLGWEDMDKDWRPVQEDRVKPKLKAIHFRANL